ncbi:MAG: DMT family transporter [Gammaproteobacteria bacterium]|nr:DMT family transporter [Gammaproteobacteria bacterium]
MPQQFSKGAFWLLLSCLVLPLMDATAKSFNGSMASSQIAFFRFLLQSLIILPFAWRALSRDSLTHLSGHLIRAAGLGFATICFFGAIQVMPIADALAIFFCEPLIVTVLAPLLLGEKVGWRRYAAVVVGFIGAIIIIQPSQQLFGYHALMPIGAAFGFSLYVIYTRKLSASASAMTMQLITGVIGAAVIAAVSLVMMPLSMPIFSWSMPTTDQLPLLLLLGIFAALGHWMLTHAFKFANASVLAPLQYTELIGATFVGWWLFDDIPLPSTWLGSAILIGAGFYIWHRERLHQPADN